MPVPNQADFLTGLLRWGVPLTRFLSTHFCSPPYFRSSLTVHTLGAC